MRRSTAVLLMIAMISLALTPSIASAEAKSKKEKSNKQVSSTFEKDDEKSKKMKGAKQISTSALDSFCDPTSASGHAPKRLRVPSIDKPHVEKTITLITNCGTIKISADGVAAPLTVISMSYLANKGFFNKAPCHRITTEGIYVLQCGDPTASGSGGPTWQVPDENLPLGAGNIYPYGTGPQKLAVGRNRGGAGRFAVLPSRDPATPGCAL